MHRRRRFKQVTTLQDRIAEWATGVRDQVNGMKPGPERDELIKKLRQAETAMHMEDWASSPDCSRQSKGTTSGRKVSVSLRA
jgi:hypothetical protein